LNKLKKFGIFTVASLTTSILAVSLVVQPAMADDDVILPPGANGTNDNPDLLSIACPAMDESEPFVEVLAPAPVSAEGFSAYESLQEGGFSWTLGNGRGGSVSQQYSPSNVYTEVLRLELSEDSVAGAVLDLTLTGSIVDGPTTYTPTEVEFQTTVIDPTFSQGEGTSADPFLIFNQNDLKKIRCHTRKHFALANDISLSGKWLPIGTSSYSWQGSLDGRGFTISNLNAGFFGLNDTGLFGVVYNTLVRNLTLDQPRVQGEQRVGALFGEANENVFGENINIVDAQVFGNTKVGLLTGALGNGGGINNTQVSGVLNATPWTYRSSETLEVMGIDEVGGMVGNDGSGNSHANNSVDVVINVKPQTNYSQLASNLGLALDEGSQIYRIGGYVGFGNEISARFLDVKSEINIEALNTQRIEQIAGVMASGGKDWNQIDAESEINIVALGGRDLAIERIGGVFGYAGGRPLSFSNSNTNITITTANGSNNTLGLIHDATGVDVRKVGGVSAEHHSRFKGGFVRAKANITIQGVTDITRVAGYTGSNNQELGYSDSFVSGKISLDASSSIQQVGGYTNLENNGELVGTRMFGAVEIEITGDAAIVEEVNPFVGERDNADQLAFDSFWDSTLNSDSNPADYPGLPATTSQLQSRSFLSNLGMDFDKVWKISARSYPELRESVYKMGASGSSSSNSGSPSVSTILRPDGPANIVIPRAVKQGSKVVIRGDRLNRVTDVFVAGKRVNYMLRTNGTLTFKAPKLDPRKYQVRLESDTAGTIFKKKIRIAAR
jgi:hypothetical protein